MKKHELESFFKSFMLFFLSMELLFSLLMYLYYTQQTAQHKEQLFLQMRQFHFDLRGDDFTIDFQDATNDKQTYKLYEDPKSFYALFPIIQNDQTLLKVVKSKEEFKKSRAPFVRSMIIAYGLLSAAIALLALLFSWYTLIPLRGALNLLERFLKDIIHDLNTPVTTLLVNARLLKKSVTPKRLERIELASKTIATLHENIDQYLRNTTYETKEVALDVLLKERIYYFSLLYPALTFKQELSKLTLLTQYEALQRIIDNILSNACKYNRPSGTVDVTLTHNTLTISDTGVGIKNTKKVFDRFYKEQARGLGIGLHIVHSLCTTLGFGIDIQSSSKGTTIKLTLS